tara:strand:+ start:395 stop:637 length:243 start_codon:yes stop_codon:yes gene_type:complete
MSEGMSEQNPENHTDLMWQTHMRMLTQRKKSLQIAQIIDDSLFQYYTVDRDLPVPNWRMIKDQDWWYQYLIDMGMDPRNP